VPLAPIADHRLVAATIAQALGLRESAGRPPADLLVDYVRERRLLLCLDNIEHLLEAAPLIAEIHRTSLEVTVLLTSRAPLRLAAEREFPVPVLAEREAVELFVERARATQPDLAFDDETARAVAAICERLDGLPLAIELAAARARLLSPQAILARLDERFDLLTGGPRDVPDRQQTLRAAIDWSHQLLEPDEQRLFARFAVFAGGARLDVIEPVCDGTLDLVESLVEKNLLIRRNDPDGEPRLDMLQTIREYARDKLEKAGEADGIRKRHARVYAEVVEAEWHAWLGGETSLMRRLVEDHANIRAAVALALATRDVDLVHGIGAGVGRFCADFGHLEEGRTLLDAMLLLAEDEPERPWGWVYFGAATIATRQSRFVDAERICMRGLESFRHAGDSLGVGMALRQLANALGARGEHARADELFLESLDVLRRAGEDRFVAWTLNDLGYSLLRQGRLAESESLLMEARELSERQGDRATLVVVLTNLAELRVRRGDPEGAAALYAEVITTYRDAAEGPRLPIPLDGLAIVAALEGRPDRAARLWGASQASLESMSAALDTVLHEERAAAITSARQALGDDEFEQLLAGGRAMSLDEAIAYALEDEPVS
jgi:predicted ATPase